MCACVCSFLCSDSLLYFFLFLSTLHGVYTQDCSCTFDHVRGYTFICRCCIMKRAKYQSLTTERKRGMIDMVDNFTSGNKKKDTAWRVSLAGKTVATAVTQ